MYSGSYSQETTAKESYNADLTKILGSDSISGTPPVWSCAPAGLTLSGASVTGTVISITATGGTNETVYLIKAKVTTTAGNVIPVFITLFVNDP